MRNLPTIDPSEHRSIRSSELSGGQRGQMRSLSPSPPSHHHHQHTPFTPNPSFFPHLRCLVTPARYLAPPFTVEERKREREKGCSPLPPCPQRPPACLPARPPLLLLSTAVAQHQTLTPAGISTLPEDPQEEPLFTG
ncbi:Hypothetical predicted protein [Xyrichtys novacula]|uniref:Uncharacterized protein n=1 Tax=Xyrichtys novacula TaxID=13765 RepID=A0AAV1FNK1_XYRNO|nr:Hypothetical predicted protein [Xyrichtys novacula]